MLYTFINSLKGIGYFTITVILLVFSFTSDVSAQQSGNPLHYTVSWLGNTYGKGGTVYTSSEWDEGGRRYGVYKNGKVIGNEKRIIDCRSAGGFKIQEDRIVGNDLVIKNCW